MPQEETAFFPSKEEQVTSFLILEESDQEHLSDDCSSLDFSDDELYDECLFSSSPKPNGDSSTKSEDEEEDGDEDDEDDDDEEEDDEEMLEFGYFDDFYLEDEIQLYVPGEDEPFVSIEDLAMIKTLTSQLKNRREVNMLKLAAVSDASLKGGESSEAVKDSDSSPDLKNAFYKDCAPFELPADFTPYAGVVPASIHNTPVGSGDELGCDSDGSSDSEASSSSDDEEGGEEDEDDSSDDEGTASSSSSDGSSGSSDSDDQGMSDSESDIDVVEIDTGFTSLTTPQKRRFIEEEDDSDGGEGVDGIVLVAPKVSLGRSVSAPVTPSGPRRGRPPQQPRSLRKTAACSPATSRPPSRSSSPAPRAARKPSQLETSLIFKMRHLLPAEKRSEVIQFIEKTTGSPSKLFSNGATQTEIDLGEEFVVEFATLAPNKLQEISDFVQLCIQAKTAFEQEALKQEALKQEALKAEPPKKEPTPPPSTPVRQTRSRRETATSRSPSDSPLNTATPKPLPTSYAARPTTRTKSAGPSSKRQKKANSGSDDEIDILGF